MDIFTTIEHRRSVKHYDPNVAIPEADFQKIIRSVLLSPTSYNIQHWRFVRVKEKQLRIKLKEAAWGQQQIEDASELIVICADINAWRDNPERYWKEADPEVQTMLVEMLSNFYHGNSQLQRDEAIRSCGIAGQTLMLAAKGLGYDTGAMVGFDPQAVSEIIRLPEGHLIGMIVAVGKATKPANPRGGQLPLNEVLFNNQFS